VTRDDLVEVPENALIEERIAFGLTAPQLGILAVAGLAAAALNLLPLWAVAKVLVILLVAGSPRIDSTAASRPTAGCCARSATGVRPRSGIRSCSRRWT